MRRTVSAYVKRCTVVMLILVLGVAATCLIVRLHRFRNQLAIVRLVESLGGKVHYKHQMSVEGLIPESSRPVRQGWFHVGREPWFPVAVWLDLSGTNLSDTDVYCLLPFLQRQNDVWFINIEDTLVTGRGWRALATTMPQSSKIYMTEQQARRFRRELAGSPGS